MAIATSSATVNSTAAHSSVAQMHESLNLKICKFVSPSLCKCRALSTCTSKPHVHLRTNAFIPVRAVATTQEPREKATTGKVTKYHFLVANAKFMLDDEEHFQELMRERLRNFGERKREQDFWLAIEPRFLDNFPDITKRLKRPAVALVSTDELWITFMKLRLDRVLRGEIEAETLAEALRSYPVDINFEKPQTWTAPYSKYDGAWWTPFLPPEEHELS